MSKVILGMPGPWAEDNYEASDHYTTKIGGLPDWPFLASTIVKPDLLKCSLCKSILCLVAQIYAPISSTNMMIEERLIYIFGCIASNCGNTPESWRALRVQRSCDLYHSSTDFNEVGDSPASSVSVSKTDFQEELSSLNSKEEKHDDDNDDGDDDDDDNDDIDLDDLFTAFSDAANNASNSSKKVNHHHRPKVEKPKKTRVVGSSTPVVPCFYIYTQEEAFSKKIDSISLSCNSLSIKENHKDLECNSPEETWDEEGYEYDKALNADRTYLKFKKRMDAYPQQCFRYSYGGKPLMATGQTTDSRPCNLCGDSRHYEMQLMPPLLYFIESALNENHKYSLENWNWMTLIIYTCSKSCSNSSDKEKPINEGWFIAEEDVVLQYE